MSEEKGNLELDLKGNIQTKQGEFDTMDNVQIEKIIKNIMYILQDSTQIKSKTQSGALKMISKGHTEDPHGNYGNDHRKCSIICST